MIYEPPLSSCPQSGFTGSGLVRAIGPSSTPQPDRSFAAAKAKFHRLRLRCRPLEPVPRRRNRSFFRSRQAQSGFHRPRRSAGHLSSPTPRTGNTPFLSSFARQVRSIRNPAPVFYLAAHIPFPWFCLEKGQDPWRHKGAGSAAPAGKAHNAHCPGLPRPRRVSTAFRAQMRAGTHARQKQPASKIPGAFSPFCGTRIHAARQVRAAPFTLPSAEVSPPTGCHARKRPARSIAAKGPSKNKGNGSLLPSRLSGRRPHPKLTGPRSPPSGHGIAVFTAFKAVRTARNSFIKGLSTGKFCQSAMPNSGSSL